MELTINDLSKEYGRKKAVNHFSAKLTNGVYGLIGANGAGKTTLMRMICDVQTETIRTTPAKNNIRVCFLEHILFRSAFIISFMLGYLRKIV